MRLSHHNVVIALSLALISTAAVLACLYPLATRPLSRPEDAALIERARSDARMIYRDADAHRRSTFPLVVRLADQTCVELRSWATGGAGSYLVCYDRRSGKKVEERSEAGY